MAKVIPEDESLASLMARDIAARIRITAQEYNDLVKRAEARGIQVECVSAGGIHSGRIKVLSITLHAKL